MGLILGVLALVATACSDDDETPSAANDDRGTTTTAETASDGDGSTTTPVPAGALGDEPTFSDEGPSGDGCTPGDGTLPAGWWYGTLEGPIDAELTIDLACYYVGAAAEAEASGRGDEVNNDVYVVNDNPQQRSLAVADSATATCVELDATPMEVNCDLDDIDGPWAVWIRVQDGSVDRVVEQYAP